MVKRTRLSICAKKRRYALEEEALAAIAKASVVLRHYRCDRCGQFHLTSRTKGKFARPSDERVAAERQRQSGEELSAKAASGCI